MRKVLLAGAALLATAGVAFAGSASVQVETEVPQVCGVQIAAGPVDLPFNGDPVTHGFQYRCNYTGDADVSFTSLYGGVSSDSGATAHNYSITSSLATGDAAAGATDTVAVVPGGVATDFTLALVDPIILAGSYEDTLTITIAP